MPKRCVAGWPTLSSPFKAIPAMAANKGVSSEYLLLLARLHQRSLAPLPEESSAPSACPPTLLPAELLVLPETLAALQGQISTLQQQVSALNHLLQQHAQPPAGPASAAEHARGPKPTRLASRS